MDKGQHIDLDENAVAEAVKWHGRINNDDVTMADLDALTDWLQRSEANQHAFEYAEQLADDVDILSSEISSELEKANLPEASSATSKIIFLNKADKPPHPRYMARWVSAIAASVAVFMLSYSFLNLSSPGIPPPQAYVAGTEVRPAILLADGSQVDLNVNSRLDVTMNREVRRTTLIDGEATFSVTPDPDRPFFVMVGDMQVRVTGTVFNIIRNENDLSVTVSEGTVEVMASQVGEGEKPLFFEKLTAGKQLHHIEGTPSVIISDVNADHILAWRHGQLIYENVALAKIIADLNRNFDVAIKFDQRSKSLRFSGILFTNDLATILALLEESLPIEIERSNNIVMIKGHPE